MPLLRVVIVSKVRCPRARRAIRAGFSDHATRYRTCEIERRT
jgi:hypothetical protein